MEFFFETDLFLKILPPNFLTSGLNSAEFRYFRFIFLQDLKVYALKKLWLLEENFTLRYSRVSQFLTFWCTSLYVRYSLGEINFTLFSIWNFSQCMSFSILRIELIITECKKATIPLKWLYILKIILWKYWVFVRTEFIGKTNCQIASDHWIELIRIL